MIIITCNNITHQTSCHWLYYILENFKECVVLMNSAVE